MEELFPTSGALFVPENAGSLKPLKLSVVVPSFNEAENIAALLADIYANLLPALGESFEVIVVDDDSPDQTWQVAAGLTESLPNLRVLRRHSERGLASAVIRGWQAARGEYLGTINADFQHPPQVLARMCALADKADLVVASRYCEDGSVGDWGLYRRMASRAAWLLGRLMVPAIFRRVTDPLSGCYLVRRSAIAGVVFHPAGYKTLIEILASGRVSTIAETGYCFERRRAGESKALPKQYWLYLRHLGRLRRSLRRRGAGEPTH